MKSIQIFQFGAPDVLKIRETSVPEYGINQVLIRVKSAGVNPVDAKTRRGLGFIAEKIKNNLPWVPGYDISGVVEAVGEQVKTFNPGDEVYGMIGFPERGDAYAQFAVAEMNEITRKPANINFDHSAAVPLAALTAWQALYTAGRLQSGQRVMILAAAGGVGHFAVQFAKHAGATVIGTASERNKDFLLDFLGCDEFIDYNDFSNMGKFSDIDLIIDAVGGEYGMQSLMVLKNEGIMVTLPTITADKILETAELAGLNATGMVVKADMSNLNSITALIESGEVKVHIDHIYPLQDAHIAHEKIETGHVSGKLALAMP
ncbi:NADP-dependent oxidoreductase [candidate division KSB1 bacterium]|nr:NADP-dependent oxidoreductase [candidate division KSB1 bacterium]